MKRKTKFVLIAFLFLIALVLGYFSLKINPQSQDQPSGEKDYHLLSSPEIPLESIFTEPDLTKIEGQLDQLPQKMMVYQIQPARITADQAKQTASFLEFEPDSFEEKQNGTRHDWITPQKYLSVSLEKATLEYAIDLLNFPGLLKEGDLPSPSQNQDRLASFLKENIVPLPESVDLKLREWQYLKTRGPQFEETTSEQGRLIKFKYDLVIDDQVIINHSPKESLVSIIVGPDLEIFRIDYQAPFSTLAATEAYPLKNKTEIINEIINQPQITAIVREDHQIASTNNYLQIKTINVIDAKAGYFVPLESRAQYLQPVFYFEANGVLLETGFTTFFLIPAIKNQYLSPGP